MSSQDDTNKLLFDKIDSLASLVSDLRVEVVALKTELYLQRDISKLVAEHEQLLQQAKGGWKLAAGAVISSGLLGGMVAHYLRNH